MIDGYQRNMLTVLPLNKTEDVFVHLSCLYTSFQGKKLNKKNNWILTIFKAVYCSETYWLCLIKLTSTLCSMTLWLWISMIMFLSNDGKMAKNCWNITNILELSHVCCMETSLCRLFWRVTHDLRMQLQSFFSNTLNKFLTLQNYVFCQIRTLICDHPQHAHVV